MATLAQDQPCRIALASEPPFRLGALLVVPALRQVSEAGASRTLEPRVMQVLVALARAQGEIVGRDALIELCWHGRIVGENAINRVISLLRHLAAETGAFEIETVTKVGYRLKLKAVLGAPAFDASEAHEASRRTVSRRGAIVAAGAIAVGGMALLSPALRSRPNGQAREYYEAGLRVSEAGPENVRQAVAYFRRAVQADPNFAAAWGELAFARLVMLQSVHEAEHEPLVSLIEQEAGRALRLDPADRKATLALTLLRPDFGNWVRIEKETRAALARMPEEILLHRKLGWVLAHTGRWRGAAEAFALVAAREPLVPAHQATYAAALWHVGDVRAARARYDAAVRTWPMHEWLWMSRYLFLSFTRQTDDALAMTDHPIRFSGSTPLPANVGLEGAVALQTQTRTDVERAVETIIAARNSGKVSSFISIRYLAALGAIDTAYGQAFDYFLGKRDPVTGERQPLPSMAQRHTDFLFMSATAPMRADARFPKLTAAIGLDSYWAATRSSPDYRLG